MRRKKNIQYSILNIQYPSEDNLFSRSSHCWLRSLILIVALGVSGFCREALCADDPVLMAIQTEIARTMTDLRLPDSPKPYFVSCAVTRNRYAGASATLGAIVNSSEATYAGISVVVRVGDYSLDNSNFRAKMGGDGGSRLDWAIETPIDGDPEVIRRAIWWAMDMAYKNAVENLKRKRTVLQNRSTPPVADDFAKAPVNIFLSPEPAQALPTLATLADQARELSKLLVQNRNLRESDANVNAGVEERWYANSEGTKVCSVANNASVTASAVAQSDDGVMIGDIVTMAAKRREQLPGFDEQKAAVIEMGKRVETMRDAPLLDDFAGPVLFEGQAAAELCVRLLPEMFGNKREPLIEGEGMGFSMSDQKKNLRRKIGRRVMATNFDVTDDPTLQSFDGVPLVGSMPVDLEGVKPEKVELVKNGVLKTLLTTRVPDKKLPASNGHALGRAYDMGQHSAAPDITSLIINYQNGLEEKELKDKLLQAVKDQDVEYGLVIRRIPPEGLRLGQERMSYGRNDDEGLISAPLHGFCVYPDGTEKLVRIVALKGVAFTAFKDVLAAGRKMTVYNFGRGRLKSIVAPSLLFEEGIVVKPERNISKPPLLKSPLLADDDAKKP